MNESIDPIEVPRLVHTALRKCCDSKPTTLAYCLIHALPPEPWIAYCKLLVEKSGGVAEMTPTQMQNAAREIAQDVPREMPVRVIALVFNTFDAGDFQGAAAFLDRKRLA